MSKPVAMLIGDKTGPEIIAHTYGDVRPDHLLKQAQRMRLTAQGSSIEGSITSSDVAAGSERVPQGTQAEKVPVPQGV